VKVSAYSLLYAIGAIASVLLIDRLAARISVEKIKARVICSILIPSGLLGSMLLVYIFKILIPANLYVSEGSSMFGGVITAIIMIFVLSKAMKIPVRVGYDLIMTALPLGFSIGKLGCLMAGCCAGDFSGIPVQIISSIADLLILMIMLRSFKINGSDGLQVFRFCSLYGLKRFLEGFFRIDAPRNLAGFSIFQWFGVAFFICGLSFLILISAARKHLQQRQI